MSGSSKSLIKALDSIFEGMNGSARPDTTDLFCTISDYLEKHNTLPSIKQSVNMSLELKRVYDEYVRPGEDIEKEVFFVEVLIHIIPCFIEEADVMTWAQVYLKPAVNSAGYDVRFVDKSRELIKKIIIDPKSTNDDFLAARRTQIGIKVITTITEIYLGKYKMVEEAPNSHLLRERIRFVQMNCTDILVEYGLKNPVNFFNVLETFFPAPENRHLLLTLLSALLSRETCRAFELVDTNLFKSLLFICAYDKSDTVAMALSVISMVLPQVCHKVGPYISDIFFVLFRVIGSLTVEQNKSIQINKWDPTIGVMTSRYEFDSLCLLTILYGLFPFNVTKFSQRPLLYLSQNKGLFANSRFEDPATQGYRNSDIDPNQEDQILIAQKKMISSLQSFTLHPKFLKFDCADLDDELRSPLDWIIDARDGRDLRSEEIAIACYSLNPALSMDDNESKFKSSRSSYADLTRHESISGKLLFKNAANISNSNHGSERTSIVWKDVNFGEKEDSTLSAPEDVSELFTAHEKLYHAYSKRSSVTPSSKSGEEDDGTPMEFYERELLLMKNELYFSLYMQHLNKVHLSNFKLRFKEPKSNKRIEGLEALCNELEQAVKIIQLDSEKAHDRSQKIIKEYEEQLKQLRATLTQLTEEHALTVSELNEKSAYLEEIVSSKLPESNAQISDLKMIIQDLENKLKNESKILSPNRLGPVGFKTSLDSNNNNDYFGSVNSMGSVSSIPLNAKTPTILANELTDHEVQLHNLRSEFLLEIEKNKKISQEMIKLTEEHNNELQRKEQSIIALKSELSKNVASHVSHYEKKIQELSAIIFKYETQLEQRNAKIAQLSTSRPISIPLGSNAAPVVMNPGIVNTGAHTPSYEEEVPKTRSNSSVDSTITSPPQALRQNSTASFPIIKGRGGYQKRLSKKM